MAKTFKSVAEAKAIMGPLYAAKKIDAWSEVNCFGRVTVKTLRGSRWFTLTADEFNALVSHA